MYEALVARVRYHIQKANFMGLKEAESTLLLAEAADALEELSKPRWIPVKEQLPEEDGHYLVYIFCEADEQLRGWTQIAWFRRKFYWEHSGEWYREVITHWMPLPEPPKEEEA